MPKFREIPKVFHTLDAYDPFVARKELPQNFYILRQLLFIRSCKKMFKDVSRKLQLAQIVPQNVNAYFGNCDVITLGDMDVSMSHLIT